MILQCPGCETCYELPVALPPEGRKVRCAACHHVWTATTVDEAKAQISMADFEDDEVVFKPDEEAEAAADTAAADFSAHQAGHAAADPGTGEADEGFNESALERAFNAAVEEAQAAEAGLDPDAGDEPESPPIVIGKAKRRRGSLPAGAAAGWAALLLFVAGVVGIAYFQRVGVVRAFPGAAAAYERLGLPVNVRGLEFENVRYSWESSAGRPVLEVYGDIINITSRPLKVPTVVFGLRTKEKVEVYQWAADVRSEMLPAGERTAFSAQIPTPPKSIRDVQVRFAKVR